MVYTMGAKSSTQIANAYGENIWIKVSGDRASVSPWKLNTGETKVSPQRPVAHATVTPFVTNSTPDTFNAASQNQPAYTPAVTITPPPRRRGSYNEPKINASDKKEVDWIKVETQFMIIQPGRCLSFDVPVSPRRPTVYVSILTSTGRIFLDSLPKIDDISLIVTSRGEIRYTDHGKIWIDRTGQRHFSVTRA